MGGFLVPDHFNAEAPPLDDLLVASIIWGFSLAAGFFGCVKCVRQTRQTWRRARTANAYIIMIWAEWASSMIIGVISWLYLRGIIPTEYVYFYLSR